MLCDAPMRAGLSHTHFREPEGPGPKSLGKRLRPAGSEPRSPGASAEWQLMDCRVLKGKVERDPSPKQV